MEDRSWERSWAAISDGSEWSARPVGGETAGLDGHRAENDPQVPEWMSSDENETGAAGYTASIAVSVDHDAGPWAGQDDAAWPQVQSEVHGAEDHAGSPYTGNVETAASGRKQAGMDLREVRVTPGDTGGSVRVELRCGQQEVAATWAGDETKALLAGPLEGLVPAVDQVTLRHSPDGWKLEIGLNLGESTIIGTWSVGEAAGEVALPLETVQAEIRREFVRTLQSALAWSNEAASPFDAGLDPVA